MFLGASKILNKKEKYFRFLLVFTALLFLFLHLFAAYVQQATPDEMSQVYLLQQYGFSGTYFHLSEYFNVRWISLFVSNAFLFFMQNSQSYRMGSVLIYTSIVVLFVFSFHKLLSELKIKCEGSIWLGIIFYTSFYFFTVASIELFGWVSGALTYLLPASVFLFFIACWFKTKWRLIDYVSLFVCSVILGGCAENFFVFAILLSAFFMIYNYFHKPGSIKSYSIKFSIFLFASFIGFLPGKSILGIKNKIHVLKDLPDEFAIKSNSMSDSFFISDFHFFEPRMLFAVLLLGLCAWVISPQLKISSKILKYCFWFLLGVILLNFTASFYLFGNLGSGRFWSPVYFFAFLMIFLLLINFLGKQGDEKNILIHTRLATAAACALILSYYTIDHFPALYKYLKHTNELSAAIELHKAKNEKGALSVKSYPSPEIIVENVITRDTSHFFNVCLVRYYQCSFPIVLNGNNK